MHSPCVRNCCLDENDICLGCFRSIDEILRWAGASEQEQRQIIANCEQRRKERERNREQKINPLPRSAKD